MRDALLKYQTSNSSNRVELLLFEELSPLEPYLIFFLCEIACFRQNTAEGINPFPNDKF